MSRFAIRSLPLSLKTKQRIYNFVGEATAPTRELLATAHSQGGRSISFKADLRDDLSRMWYYWGYEHYERPTVRVFCELLKTKSCVLDVGANIGYYALLAARAIEGRGEVHAFEPCPRVFRWLNENAQLNRFSCLTVNPIAVSDVDDKRLLFLPADSAGTNASLVKDFTPQNGSVITDVARLDTYCASAVKRPIDLLKIDAEGAETNVLRGCGSLLDKDRPDIICEVLEPFTADVNAVFKSTEYRAFLITDSGLVETPTMIADSKFRDYYLTCSARVPVNLLHFQ